LHGFDKEAASKLAHYHWPGNVRELENTIERCVTLAEPGTKLIEADLLPDEFQSPYAAPPPLTQIGESSLVQSVEQLERTMVTAALKKFGGNRTRAAEHLGLSRRGLLNKIERYQLEV